MQSKFTPVVLALSLLSLLGGCAARTGTSDPAASLLTSIQATAAGDSVDFLLQVTNTGTRPLGLEFSSDPIVYFTVGRGDLLLWNSAPELAPTRSTRVDSLAAGDTRTFRASWAPPMGLRGTLTVTGVLLEGRRPLIQSADFRIP